jgi:hypothetical protein
MLTGVYVQITSISGIYNDNFTLRKKSGEHDN